MQKTYEDVALLSEWSSQFAFVCAGGGSGGCRSSRLYSEVATLPVIREEDQIELRSIGDLSRFESVMGKAIIRLSCEGY